jgi:hypothetical protein
LRRRDLPTEVGVQWQGHRAEWVRSPIHVMRVFRTALPVPSAAYQTA